MRFAVTYYYQKPIITFLIMLINFTVRYVFLSTAYSRSLIPRILDTNLPLFLCEFEK